MSSTNGHNYGPSPTDWDAYLSQAERILGFADQRHACGNPDCPKLCESLFCSEACRERTEGPDHEDAFEPEEPNTTNEPSGQQNTTSSILSGFSGGRPAALPEAPVSLNTVITLAGRSVQVTLRGTTLAPVLQQMEALLARYPVQTPAQTASAAPQSQGQTPICPQHQHPMKPSTKAEGTFYCTRREDDGSFCSERFPRKGQRHD
jgi:hypothetical protein